MVPMRLLVHIAGEADLLLNSRPAESSKELRAERVATRRTELAAVLAGPDGLETARDMLTQGGAWKDDPFSTPAPSPLLGALAALEATPDLEVMVLGTTQKSPHPLNTLPIAQTIAEVINRAAAEDESYLARRAEAVPVHGLNEKAVVDAITHRLGDAPRYQQTLLTWGSGATKLAMGALTALSRAGLAWQLVRTSDSAAYDIVNPLDQLDVDPVAGVFVRWRMFAALEEAARDDRTAVQLTDTQRDLVRRAADRHRAGFEARDCASLRAVLADAVVRRDGTASLAVRRYVVSRYEELFELDRATRPGAVDLLCKYEKGGGPPLGAKLNQIKKDADRNNPVVRASVDLPSYKWLFGPEVESLQNIGKGSHTLRPPAAQDAEVIGDYLSGYAIDGAGWRDAGLPEPPVTPADTALVVWPVGIGESKVSTIAEQLTRGGLPPAVQDYLGVEKARIRAVIFGVEGEGGSSHHAEADAELIRTATGMDTVEPGGKACVDPIEPTGADPVAVERAIERRVTRETGALLLIPTGRKPIVLAMLSAMHRIGARYGIPLFVRETADPPSPDTYTEVHQWPALTGGDIPLLEAAQRALRVLELDVAWRLLAASAIDAEITDKARRLASAFACRQPLCDAQWPEPDPAPTPDLADRATGMIIQRLALVNEALTYATTTADWIRLLVLAADVMEASIAATRTCGKLGEKYRKFRERLHKRASQRGIPDAKAARILLLLNGARDAAPITHGTETDPNEFVADARSRLATKWGLSGAETDALPSDVSALLRSAVIAADALNLGRNDQRDNLVILHKALIDHVKTAIDRRPVHR